MTQKHPTKVEVLPNSILLMVGKGIKAVALLIGCALAFSVLFVWHLFLNIGSNRCSRCRSNEDHERNAAERYKRDTDHLLMDSVWFEQTRNQD